MLFIWARRKRGNNSNRHTLHTQIDIQKYDYTLNRKKVDILFDVVAPSVSRLSFGSSTRGEIEWLKQEANNRNIFRLSFEISKKKTKKISNNIDNQFELRKKNKLRWQTIPVWQFCGFHMMIKDISFYYFSLIFCCFRLFSIHLVYPNIQFNLSFSRIGVSFFIRASGSLMFISIHLNKTRNYDINMVSLRRTVLPSEWG